MKLSAKYLLPSRALLSSALAALFATAGCGRKDEPVGDTPPPQSPSGSEETLAEERRRLDETVWADEVTAQRYESAFVDLWDRLRAAAEPLAELKRFPFHELQLGTAGGEQEIARGITHQVLVAPQRRLDPAAFASEIDRLATTGYQLEQSEWHHAHFEPGGATAPRSTVSATLHLQNPDLPHRVIVKAKLKVTWSEPAATAGTTPVADRIEATEVNLWHSRAPTTFERLARFAPEPDGSNQFADPVLAHDLDGDGLSEIVIGGRNILLGNRGGGAFEEGVFIESLPAIFESAVLADFDGSGSTDFLCIGRDGFLRLYPRLGGSRFSSAPIQFEGVRFDNPMVVTAGDIDSDGDLDLWVGQYRPPYAGGHMPTPYYDANDGLPAFLLVNDGRGHFRDATAGSGLESKRFRRTYSASFVDLDDDGSLDLLVTSDFAGIDLYRGNGAGKFTNTTADWVDSRHNFGMAHTLGDYDRDGRLDFYVIGMSSATARRLDSMGLVRNDRPHIHQMRAQMGYGNRMYLARDEKFVEPPFRDSLARTGWSWGCSSFDLENDGDLDIYVANGHRSGESARDYCTSFWRHDIYTGTSEPDLEVSDLFKEALGDLGQRKVSWNGYEHNAMLVNLGSEGFVDLGYLAGVAFEDDSRAVLSDDLDSDGAVDLLVVTNSLSKAGTLTQTLHLMRNRGEHAGNWIGLRVRDAGSGKSALGAKVKLVIPSGESVRAIVSGDSLYAQHAPTVHFGLGAESEVTALELRWPDGTKQRLENPEPNRYHTLPVAP